jgi:phosphatidylinositol alpha-1,6-mannosyltransferase
MKILMLSWNFAPVIGGLEDLVTQQFAGLRRAGNDVQIATAHAHNVSPQEGVWRAARPGLFAYLLHALRTGWSLARRWRPDVILCGSVVTVPIGWLLSRWFRVRFVVIVYGGDLVYEHWLVRPAIRFALRGADRVVAISRHTLDLAESIGLDPARMSIVPPGVDLDPFDTRQPVEPIDGEPDVAFVGRRVLLSVGRLVRRKGILEFVERVLPRLVEADPSVLYLVVGGDATASLAHRERLSDKIGARIEELGLADHARLLGQVPDAKLVALFRRADLFVLPVLDVPGDIEGFGIVFLEAALGFTASVSTRVGGIPDAVVDGETGALVAPGDDDAMADAIGRLLADGELRDQLARQGEARARSEFGWDAIAARLEKVLAGVQRGS